MQIPLRGPVRKKTFSIVEGVFFCEAFSDYG
nr:MAG TPA: hypothetical protein [Caudoviricetes sp.]